MSKVSVHQRKARDFIQREDWGNALVELERMLEADGENPTLHNQIGDVHLRKEDVQRACEHFERAIDLYAEVGLHNNAVALCKKVMRLRPGRFEMRFRLARLRLDQGFRSEAATFFSDYLDHVPTDAEYAERLESNCREMVELLPEDAPVGKILEKLETAARFIAAFEIVRKLARRAADAGDNASAGRYTEKLRSLRILVERSGGRDLLAEPQTTSVRAPAPDAAAESEAPAAAASPPPTGLDALLAPPVPGMPDLDSMLRLDAPAEVALAERPERELPEPGPTDGDPDAGRLLQLLPPVDEDPEAGQLLQLSPQSNAEPADAPPSHALPALNDAPATDDPGDWTMAPPQFESPAGATPVDPDEPPVPSAMPSYWNEPRPLDLQADAREYELGASSFAELAQDLGEDVVLPERPAAAAASDAAPTWTPEPASWGAAPSASPEPAPPAAPPFATPAASSAGWLEELRRAPVWIPTGDTLISTVQQPPADGPHMELESVIDSFREQMSRALDGDGAARYDLGVAYYEMGLYNEALAEFEVASRCPGLEVQSYEMLAACLLQTGRHAEVVELLLPILAADGHSARGRLGLQYSMGQAYEALGDWVQAQRCFEEVALVDIDFKDVQDRLHRT